MLNEYGEKLQPWLHKGLARLGKMHRCWGGFIIRAALTKMHCLDTVHNGHKNH